MTLPTFDTSDIALAAYLSLMGKELTDVKRISGQRFTFRFLDYSGREADFMRFLNRKVTVEPNAFLDHLKSLKAMLPD